MPYKPKHCCQCGEKIDRIDWKPWTSRRFCELCETELGIYDWIPRILVGIGLLFGLYGVGSYFQKPETQLHVASNQLADSNAKSNLTQPKALAQVSIDNSIQLPTQSSNSAAQTKTSTASVTSNLKHQPAVVSAADAPEKTYFCGAQTKKGAMCSRRIKNGGRCWQHEGQTAMLPQEKLLAAQ
jgi:hypothetical protein